MKILLQIFLVAAVLFTTMASLAWAQTYADDCSDLDGREYVTSENLVQLSTDYGEEAGWIDAPDKTCLSMQDPAKVAFLQYQVQGVSSLEVGFYSVDGTFATQSSQGAFGLGYPFGTERPDVLYPVLFDPQLKQAYLPKEKLRLGMDEFGVKRFIHPYTGSSEDALRYGLNVLISEDGKVWRGINCQLERVLLGQTSSGDRRYYEQYSAEIPAGVCYVRIALFDQPAFEMEGMGLVENTVPGTLRVAEVVLEGETLTFGEEGSIGPTDPTDPSDPVEPADPGSAFDEMYTRIKKIIDLRSGGKTIEFKGGDEQLLGVAGVLETKLPDNDMQALLKEMKEARLPEVSSENEVAVSAPGNISPLQSSGGMKGFWMAVTGIYVGGCALLLTVYLLPTIKKKGR